MNDLEMLNIIHNFPIGEIPKNRNELLSKAEIISFLARFQDQFSAIDDIEEREMSVKTFLGETLTLEEGEVIPSLTDAETTLKLSSGFIQDFGRVQYIKENNPDFDRTYDLIATNLGLTNEAPRKSR